MNFRTFTASLLLFGLMAGLIACSSNNNNITAPDYSAVPKPYDTTGTPRTVQNDGLIIYHIKAGSGPFQVVPQDQIQIEYTGRTTDGKIFDSTYEKSRLGVPFVMSPAATDGSGNFSYVRGFREGLLGMKKGEERTLVIPPDLGYAGTTNKLAGDTLIFDIKLIGFQ